MELRDIVVTPVLIIILYTVAYILRPRLTDNLTRRYFFPALTVKIIGALAVGFIYQFYYHGGDTFNFHTYGSRIIWNAFMDSPLKGIKIFLGSADASVYNYTSHILFYHDPSSFFIIRLAGFFDLLTFSSYASTAILFSIISFIGSWMFFLTFYQQYPKHHLQLAWAALFIPSVIFWGSGLLKDSITLSCLGIATFQIYKIMIRRKVNFFSVLLLLCALFFTFMIKKFILQAFLPAVILWIFADRFYAVRSTMLRILLIPIVLFLLVVSAYYSIEKIGEGDRRYDLSKIAKTARITAYDIRYWSGKDAGSGYSLGELDDSFASLLVLAPAAVNVSLFRPYLWEVRNPLMLLTALESLALLFLCLYLVLTGFRKIIPGFKDPNVLFCLSFSIIFAFAVGVSTFNFGTLARYKIPILPYFLTSLVILSGYSNRDKNNDSLEATE